jgi:hypothetical protein
LGATISIGSWSTSSQEIGMASWPSDSRLDNCGSKSMTFASSSDGIIEQNPKVKTAKKTMDLNWNLMRGDIFWNNGRRCNNGTHCNCNWPFYNRPNQIDNKIPIAI